MSEIRNKYILAPNKFMLKMHLRQPRFTYSAKKIRQSMLST